MPETKKQRRRRLQSVPPLFGVHRLLVEDDIPSVDDTQPNPGWGFICAHCKHTFADDEKYIDFPPELPCNRLQYDRGGYDKGTYPPQYISPAPIFDLRRYVDGSESCPKYEIQ